MKGDAEGPDQQAEVANMALQSTKKRESQNNGKHIVTVDRCPNRRRRRREVESREVPK